MYGTYWLALPQNKADVFNARQCTYFKQCVLFCLFFCLKRKITFKLIGEKKSNQNSWSHENKPFKCGLIITTLFFGCYPQRSLFHPVS